MGVEQSYKRALEYYEQAALLGVATSMNNVGWLYHNGLGVEQSYTKAKEYYKRAIAEDEAAPNPLPISNLAFLLDQNNGTEPSHTKVREWYEKAITVEDAKSQYQMGVAYEQGNGVTKSLSKAKEWYAKAAVQNEPRAIKAMKRLNIHVDLPVPAPVEHGSNKKSCWNCGRPEESDHPLKECQRCRSSIYYCNSSCKKGHWKAHKKECKRLAKLQ